MNNLRSVRNIEEYRALPKSERYFGWYRIPYAMEIGEWEEFYEEMQGFCIQFIIYENGQLILRTGFPIIPKKFIGIFIGFLFLAINRSAKQFLVNGRI
jgi:hypothetical protein